MKNINTFSDFKNNHIISYIDIFSKIYLLILEVWYFTFPTIYACCHVLLLRKNQSMIIDQTINCQYYGYKFRNQWKTKREVESLSTNFRWRIFGIPNPWKIRQKSRNPTAISSCKWRNFELKFLSYVGLVVLRIS
jgi:hypothetical protein